jgi:dTDP-4-dehydrorhamnose reductase
MDCLVLGAKGMAGHIIYQRLKDTGHHVVGTSRHTYFKENDLENVMLKFDALNKSSWDSFFNVFNEYDVIINCIGMLVKACEQNPKAAFTVNADLPKYLESRFKGTKTKIIHISTDCVFSGSKGNYSVLDIPDETNVYGLSKRMGEICNNKDLTIRTSIIGLELMDKVNAKDNSGLLHWFLSQPKGSEIEGYSECYWSGISTIELADAILWYLESAEQSSGLHQVSRDQKISKYDLLTLANKVFEMDLEIKESSFKKVDKSLIPSKSSFRVITSYEDMLLAIKEYKNGKN